MDKAQREAINETYHAFLHAFIEKAKDYDLIVLDELFYLKPSEENLQLLYRTVMFLSESRSFIFVTNRSLSEWDSMGVDKHTVSTFRQRILMDAQLIHLG